MDVLTAVPVLRVRNRGGRDASLVCPGMGVLTPRVCKQRELEVLDYPILINYARAWITVCI